VVVVEGVRTGAAREAKEEAEEKEVLVEGGKVVTARRREAGKTSWQS
jgi:hypothetical protein